MKFAGYYVDFSSAIEKKDETEQISIDSLVSLDPRITADVLALIKKNPLFVATEHVKQGATQDELAIQGEKKKEYEAVLKGLFIRSTKKHLHVLGIIFINGEKLYIVMHNNSGFYPFQLRQDAVHGRFDKPIMLPHPIKFRAMHHCV